MSHYCSDKIAKLPEIVSTKCCMVFNNVCPFNADRCVIDEINLEEGNKVCYS